MTALAVAGMVSGAAGVLRGEGTLPTEVGEGDAAAEIVYTVCAQGVLKECGKITQQRCTSWVTTTGGGGITVQPRGGGLTATASQACASFTSVETKIYKDRYQAKT
jgi:hypothetical protein